MKQCLCLCCEHILKSLKQLNFWRKITEWKYQVLPNGKAGVMLRQPLITYCIILAAINCMSYLTVLPSSNQPTKQPFFYFPSSTESHSSTSWAALGVTQTFHTVAASMPMLWRSSSAGRTFRTSACGHHAWRGQSRLRPGSVHPRRGGSPSTRLMLWVAWPMGCWG